MYDVIMKREKRMVKLNKKPLRSIKDAERFAKELEKSNIITYSEKKSMEIYNTTKKGTF